MLSYRAPQPLASSVLCVALVAVTLTISTPVAAQAQTLTAIPVQPVNGATDVDLLGDIQWTSVPSAEAYYLYVGTIVGANDLINSGEILQTSYPAIGLPAGSDFVGI